MDADTIEKIKLKLLSRQQELFSRLALLEHDLKDPAERPLKALEKAKMETGTLMKTLMGDRGCKELLKINHALDRIETGTYGVCFICKQPISFKRMNLLPETTLCRKCARKVEVE